MEYIYVVMSLCPSSSFYSLHFTAHYSGDKRKFEKEPIQQPGIFNRIWNFFWAPTHSEPVIAAPGIDDYDVMNIQCNIMHI
jgi:hypothetical protein